MAKGKESYSGDLNDGARYSGELAPGKRYRVTFQQNRRYELTVGRELFVFGPGSVMELPAAVVEHPDFKQQGDVFSVMEVE